MDLEEARENLIKGAHTGVKMPEECDGFDALVQAGLAGRFHMPSLVKAAKPTATGLREIDVLCSTEKWDIEKEMVMQKAVMTSMKDYFFPTGAHFNWDHRWNNPGTGDSGEDLPKHDSQWLIGKGLGYYAVSKPVVGVGVHGFLYKFNKHSTNAWNMLGEGGHLGASIEGSYLKKSKSGVVESVLIHMIAITPNPINSETSVKIHAKNHADNMEFSKALDLSDPCAGVAECACGNFMCFLGKALGTGHQGAGEADASAVIPEDLERKKKEKKDDEDDSIGMKLPRNARRRAAMKKSFYISRGIDPIVAGILGLDDLSEEAAKAAALTEA